jgi:hypothetical protein
MKLIILRLDSANKPSPMSKGVTEIQINSQPCKGINLTTRHMQARRVPWVTIIHDVTKKPGQVLHRPSVVFDVYALADTPWVARTLSYCTLVKWGKVSSNSSTRKATQFGDSICLACVSTFKCMFIQTQPMRASIDIGRGYHLGALNLRSRPLLTFPSNIHHFPLISPPGLQLCQPFDQFAKPHRISIDRKGPIASGFQPFVFYW